MREFVFVVLLCVCLSAAAVAIDDNNNSSNNNGSHPAPPKVIVEGQTEPVRDLKDSKACYEGKECLFAAAMKLDIKEKAESAQDHSKKAKGGMNLRLKFSIISQCGNSTSLFYKLQVTDYISSKDKDGVGAAEIKKFPCYFDQIRETGEIVNVYSSPDDKKFASRIKHGLIQQLAQRIHHQSLEKIKQSPKGDAISYIFEDSDISGRYTARHTLTKTMDDDIELTMKKEYVDANDKDTGEVHDGQKMDMKQEAEGKAKLDKDGRVKDVKADDKMQLGTSKQLEGKNKPTSPMASPGKTDFKNMNEIRRIGERNITEVCRTGPVPGIHIEETDIQSIIPPHYRARSYRKPFTQEEMTEDKDFLNPKNPTKDLKKAAKMLAAAGTNTIVNERKIHDLTHEGNAARIYKYAKKLYLNHRLSHDNFKIVLGALSGVRCDASYKSLLQVLSDSSLDEDLQMQAIVSLIHADDEKPAPMWLVDAVRRAAEVASNPRIQSSATMLYSGLLRSHPTTTAAPHLKKLAKELASLDPNAERDKHRALALLGALGNSGPRFANVLSSTILPFAHSIIPAVRESARATLQIDLGLALPSNLQVNPNFAAPRRSSMYFLHGPSVSQDILDRWAEEAQPDDNDIQASSLSLDSSSSASMASAYPSAHDWMPFANVPDNIDTPDTSDDWHPYSDIEESKFGADSGDEYQLSDVNGGMLGNLKNIIDKKWNIVGGGDFSLKAKVKGGSRYDRYFVEGFLSGQLDVKVYTYDSNVLDAGASAKAGLQRSTYADAPPIDGQLSLRVLIMGQIVANEDFQIDASKDVHFGGTCPVNVFTCKDCRWRPETMFRKTLFKFVKRFQLGPVPVKVTIEVIGGLGYQQIFGAYIDCNGNEQSMIGGIQLLGELTIKMEAAVDIGIASAGIEGVLDILKGGPPGYILGRSKSICGHIDLEIQAVSGKISLFVQVIMMGRFTMPLLKWKGPTLKIPILKLCLPMRHKVGQFAGSRSNLAAQEGGPQKGGMPKWERKFDRDMYKAFGKNFREFPTPGDYDPSKDTKAKRKEERKQRREAMEKLEHKEESHEDAIDQHDKWPAESHNYSKLPQEQKPHENKEVKQARRTLEKFEKDRNQATPRNDGKMKGNRAPWGPKAGREESYEELTAAAKEIGQFAHQVLHHMPTQAFKQPFPYNFKSRDMPDMDVPPKYRVEPETEKSVHYMADSKTTDARDNWPKGDQDDHPSANEETPRPIDAKSQTSGIPAQFRLVSEDKMTSDKESNDHSSNESKDSDNDESLSASTEDDMETSNVTHPEAATSESPSSSGQSETAIEHDIMAISKAYGHQ